MIVVARASGLERFDGDELVRAEGPDAPAWGEPQSEESDSEEASPED